MNDLSQLTGKLLGGRYQIVEPLGHGAFGHTFLARDQAAGREVAVKLLDPRGTADWKAFELFEREAAVLRSLRHQAIPEVFELLREEGSDKSAIFLVMEFVDGVSLELVIDEGRSLEPQQTLHLFLEMLGVLEYLHQRVPPVLHRDIKPANVIVRPNGLPALVDFGSVRSVLGSDEGGSTVAGTYGYMPYEQYMGQATPASDLYALGATFLHLLTGRPPREFMNQEGRIDVPSALPGDARLAPVIARMLRSSPPERFQSAAAARAALLTPSSLVSPASAPGSVSTTRMARPMRVASDPALALTAPRAFKGPVKDLRDRLVPSMWEFMDATQKQEGWGVVDWLTIGFFSIVTVGTLPLLFFSVASSRRRRLKRFVCEGVAGVAQIVSMRTDDTAFGSKIAHVGYEFEADGALHRDVDQVLPVSADRWRLGDVVEILYLPEREYDSVIVSRS